MSGWDLGKEVETSAVFLFYAMESSDKGSGALSSAVHHLPSLAQSTAASSNGSNQGKTDGVQTIVLFRNTNK